ncbi:hypothetical protein C8Q72DRAFT_859437 [Fomitopsis betulina]|nr:hypothetical protein C8Q72DRAFT_859437 [Fomitopsis betulina]
MGGEFLSDHWVAPKEGYVPKPVSELITAETVAPLLAHPPPAQSSDPIWVTENGGLRDDVWRLVLFMYLWRSGEMLDYLLGEPLCAKLRALPFEDRLAAIPVHLRPAILEANIDASFPPTILVHGVADPLVLLSESQATYNKLKDLGVRTELVTVPRGVHGLQLVDERTKMAPGAEEALERAIQFLEDELRR